MKVAIASDHAGFKFKTKISKWLTEEGYNVRDFGPDSEDSVDYPEFAHKVCEAILKPPRAKEQGGTERGILICGTGIGMSMTANRHEGIRAALCKDGGAAEMTRKHNNANVLCIGARNTNPAILHDLLSAFFNTEFEGGRHQKRIEKI